MEELEKAFKEVGFCRNLLKNILDTISIGVSYEDHEGCVVIENMASKKIWENIRFISETQTFKHSDYLIYMSKFGTGGHETIDPNNHGIFEDTIEIECIDDSIKTIHCSVANIFDETGGPIGSILVSQDITELRRSKETIENSERKFREIIELADEGYWVIDKNMNTVFVNRRLSEILGYAPEELIGKKMAGFMEDGGRCDFFPGVNETAGPAENHSEHIFIHRSGKKINVKMNAKPIIDAKGGYDGAFALITDVTETKELKKQVDIVKSEFFENHSFNNIIGKSDFVRYIAGILPVISHNDCNILIEGPSGTGKGLVARVIHKLSPRAEMPFVTVNCGAIPEQLLESELFGYTKGSFTDAKYDKAGKFSAAEGGYIFLDEIGEMPIHLQAKILRFIEEKQFEPVGSSRTVNADVQVIAATNKNLHELTREGKFREDLYYRLKVVSIKIPPLRERREDIFLLADYFISKLNKKYSKNVLRLSEEVMAFFISHDFPGNIRELQNIIEHAFLFCGADTIKTDHLPREYKSRIISHSQDKYTANTAHTINSDHSLNFSRIETPAELENFQETGMRKECGPVTVESLEKDSLIDALKKNGFNRQNTAACMGISRVKLWRRMKKYGLI